MLYWKNRHDGYFVLHKEFRDNMSRELITTMDTAYSVVWLTYTSRSLSSEGSFFFFSFALARSFSFLQNKQLVSLCKDLQLSDLSC